MRFQPGDMVFTRDGRPAVVVGRKDTGHVKLERKGEAFEKTRHFGFANGLTPKVRTEYEKVVREARQEEAPEKRVSKIKAKVDEIGLDPKNWVLRRYLEGEMSFIMNSENVHPTTFVLDEKTIL
ncbi:hypothetical protein [Pseudobacteriovorax antillogorgiicola]|uniref:Uncharacterized protein n=1 Tax=Pseudobacteriovorax antillogorgiicola TaxID=1513793 RepID=A0A1Y6BV10_9BACT|nr:hypothetical protein [Pseudobacteriovorax antillogorgiicola]TCS53842.1 hypothetical protein EDD56_107151 [Pseudobacteriovorax antillogorgiicola]SMF21655.1 hypothetical protein SAMN06296036_107121 [Pseudobacteriovorax antillogorgiicola]